METKIQAIDTQLVETTSAGTAMAALLAESMQTPAKPFGDVLSETGGSYIADAPEDTYPVPPTIPANAVAQNTNTSAPQGNTQSNDGSANKTVQSSQTIMQTVFNVAASVSLSDTQIDTKPSAQTDEIQIPNKQLLQIFPEKEAIRNPKSEKIEIPTEKITSETENNSIRKFVPELEKRKHTISDLKTDYPQKVSEVAEKNVIPVKSQSGKTTQSEIVMESVREIAAVDNEIDEKTADKSLNGKKFAIDGDTSKPVKTNMEIKIEASEPVNNNKTTGEKDGKPQDSNDKDGSIPLKQIQPDYSRRNIEADQLLKGMVGIKPSGGTTSIHSLDGSSNAAMVNKITQIVQAMASSVPIQTRVAVDGGKLGSLEIRYENATDNKVTIVVESNQVRDLLQRIAPVVTENLAYKGLILTEVAVQIADELLQKDYQKGSHKQQVRLKNYRRSDLNAVQPDVKSTVVRNYGYNTIELVA